MKLKVVRCDGRHETLKIGAPVTIQDGKGLSGLTSGEGITHYFTQEGLYDGWGMSATNLDSKQAKQLIAQVESQREIEDD